MDGWYIKTGGPKRAHFVLLREALTFDERKQAFDVAIYRRTELVLGVSVSDPTTQAELHMSLFETENEVPDAVFLCHVHRELNEVFHFLVEQPFVSFNLVQDVI